MNATLQRVLPLVVIGLLVAAGAIWYFGTGSGTKTVVAYFPRTVSVYEGSDVRVLGVPVGKVDKVEPQGTEVKVTMTYDEEVKIPADAQAVIVSPSVVGDRYIQLTPAYVDGEVMADNTELSTKLTAIPLELDEIYGSLDELTVALGPERRQRRRRADRPARADRQELRRPGCQVQADHRGLRRPEHHARQQQGRAVRLGPQAAGVHRDARRQRHDGPRLQQVAGQGLRAARRRERRADLGPLQPRRRARCRRRLRQREPGLARPQHPRHQPGREAAGEAPRRTST